MSENIPQLPQFESEPNDGVNVNYPIALQHVDRNGNTQPTQADFRYRSSDPYAVELLFMNGDEPAPWMFARQLLLEGVYEPSSTQGDVAVWPCLDEHGRAVVVIDLYSPDTQTNYTVMAPTREVMLFLDKTTECVPEGHESLIYDNTELSIAEIVNH